MAALGLIMWFVARQRSLGDAMARGESGAPLMNQDLFSDRRFAMGSIVAFTYGMALFGSTYLIPVYMQMGLQLSPSYVGAILLPSGLVLAATIAIAGRMADHYSTHILVSIGLLLLALSFALILVVHLDTPIWYVIAFTVLGRIGLGFVLPSLSLGAMRGLHKNLIAQGASAFNFTRMLGGSAGVSLCGIVLEWRLAAHGDALTRTTSSAARLAAFNESVLMLAALCLLALLAAWQLRAPEPGPPHDHGNEGPTESTPPNPGFAWPPMGAVVLGVVQCAAGPLPRRIPQCTARVVHEGRPQATKLDDGLP